MHLSQKVSRSEAPATMSVMDAIYRRHATREFTGQAADKAAVRKLLDAAVHAPTAVHEEPWAFVVIQDKDTLRRLSDSAKQLLSHIEHDLHLPGMRPNGHFMAPENVFYDATTLIVIYGKPMGPFVVADCWLAAENLMLAACAMGLGTCVIGLAVAALNTPEWKEELGVPEDMTAYAPIIVGVPSGKPTATSRKDPQILHYA